MDGYFEMKIPSVWLTSSLCMSNFFVDYEELPDQIFHLIGFSI